ncbi:MAG: hypothetical protein H0X39_01615 [Actinobacteria bacterium]|nr:hypothetical protein [Actinomycetota bacterium]
MKSEDLQRRRVISRPNLERALFVESAPPATGAAIVVLLEEVLAEVRDAVSRLQRLEDGIDFADPPKRPDAPAAAGHMQFIARPSGYSVLESEEDVPEPGELVMIGDETFQVTRIAASPLPMDSRRSAFLAQLAV